MQNALLLTMRLVRILFEQFWLIAAVLFVGSAIGWHQYLAIHPFNDLAANKHTVWDALAFTVMLAPLCSPIVFGEDVPWLLNMGRILLPFVFVGGIFKITVLRAATEKHVTRWFARTFRRHSVVCGLSQAGFSIVCELLRLKRWVVLIDPTAESSRLNHLRQALQALAPADRIRLVLIEGDATSTDVLRTAGAHHARDVYAVTGDDSVNLDVATAVRSMAMSESVRPGDIPKIYVHLKEYLTREPFNDNFMLFDSRALAGRQIVTQYPADAPWLAARDFSVAPHAMVIGLGGLGEQVARQLTRSAHYACGPVHHHR